MDALIAAVDLMSALAKFGRSIGVRFEQEATPHDAFNNLPTALEEFAARVNDAGGELWLLLLLVVIMARRSKAGHQPIGSGGAASARQAQPADECAACSDRLRVGLRFGCEASHP